MKSTLFIIIAFTYVVKLNGRMKFNKIVCGDKLSKAAGVKGKYKKANPEIWCMHWTNAVNCLKDKGEPYTNKCNFLRRQFTKDDMNCTLVSICGSSTSMMKPSTLLTVFTG